MSARPSDQLDDTPLLLPSDAVVQPIHDDGASIPPLGVTLLESWTCFDQRLCDRNGNPIIAPTNICVLSSGGIAREVGK
jgi:hypothetical protein